MKDLITLWSYARVILWKWCYNENILQPKVLSWLSDQMTDLMAKLSYDEWSYQMLWPYERVTLPACRSSCRSQARGSRGDRLWLRAGRPSGSAGSTWRCRGTWQSRTSPSNQGDMRVFVIATRWEFHVYQSKSKIIFYFGLISSTTEMKNCRHVFYRWQSYTEWVLHLN